MSREHFSSKEAWRTDLENRINNLLRSGVPTKEIAEIFGAEDFLRLVKSAAKKHGPVLIFDVKGFVDAELAKASPIQLPDGLELSGQIFLPPGLGEFQTGNQGAGIDRKATIFRTRHLIDLLTFLRLQYRITQGTNADNMVRRKSYVVFTIPEIKKAIFVNNEADNATYILHDTDIASGEWLEYAKLSKEDLQDETHARRVSRHIWPGDPVAWQNQIQEALALSFRPDFKESGPVAGPLPGAGVEQPNWQPAPEGWLPRTAIEELLNRATAWVSRRIEELLKQHPNWVSREYLDKGGHKGIAYYPPELLAELKRMSEEHQPAPEGWMHIRGIAGLLRKNFEWVEGRIPALVAEHPDWAGMVFIGRHKKVSIHYPPGLIAELKKESEEFQPAPEGWMSKDGVANLLRKTFNWVDRRIHALVAEHPDWAGTALLGKDKKVSTHYPPGLIAELKKESEEFQPAPEGWMSENAMVKALNKSTDWIRKRVKKFLEGHPDWVNYKYLDKGGGGGFAHYSPELVAELRKARGEHQPAPPEWMSARAMADALKKNYLWVNARLPVLLASHPHWVSEEYLDKSGKAGVKHYSPELFAELKKRRDEGG